jgi:hypothetical protein
MNLIARQAIGCTCSGLVSIGVTGCWSPHEWPDARVRRGPSKAYFVTPVTDGQGYHPPNTLFLGHVRLLACQIQSHDYMKSFVSKHG